MLDFSAKSVEEAPSLRIRLRTSRAWPDSLPFPIINLLIVDLTLIPCAGMRSRSPPPRPSSTSLPRIDANVMTKFENVQKQMHYSYLYMYMNINGNLGWRHSHVQHSNSHPTHSTLHDLDGRTASCATVLSFKDI